MAWGWEAASGTFLAAVGTSSALMGLRELSLVKPVLLHVTSSKPNELSCQALCGSLEGDTPTLKALRI